MKNSPDQSIVVDFNYYLPVVRLGHNFHGHSQLIGDLECASTVHLHANFPNGSALLTSSLRFLKGEIIKPNITRIAYSRLHSSEISVDKSIMCQDYGYILN